MRIIKRELKDNSDITKKDKLFFKLESSLSNLEIKIIIKLWYRNYKFKNYQQKFNQILQYLKEKFNLISKSELNSLSESESLRLLFYIDEESALKTKSNKIKKYIDLINDITNRI